MGIDTNSPLPTSPVTVIRPSPRYSPTSSAATSEAGTRSFCGTLVDEAEAVARVRGTSVNALIVDSPSAEVARVRSDKDFVARDRKLLERDKELLDRLAR